jgi:ubiquinone/menaquinone biosynthesis C-methylase UbiE
MTLNEQWQMARQAAELYERVVARHILRPWAQLLVDAAAVAKGERVLDLACGTGLVARVAAQRVGPKGHVIGIDLNPAMIGVAQSLPPADIEWREGSALAIPLPDESVVVVLCQQGLQFFPDKALALREMRRVLVRGGRVALSVWSSAGLYNSAVATALERFVDADTASRFRASRNAPGKAEIEGLARSAGFDDVTVRISRMSIHLSRVDRFVLEHLAATPIAAVIAAIDSQARENIGASVLRDMDRFKDGDGVTYPEETHVLTARAE